MDNTEKTLILIKPDAVKNSQIGKILEMYEKNNFNILAMKMIWMNEKLAAKHYEEHIGKEFYTRLVDFMTSGRLVAAVLQGEDIINRVRKLHGCTDPSKAEAGTIRQLFATDKTHNVVHASDCPETANKEIHIFFSEAEIFDN
ncbi:nucleoside-diphosphate kinase [Pectinatus brassicae]|uniref:Nucleoside diphosphate kinase n=1 Tax=Pectinatus brassicae TaxID=862415 RepID=A0A840URH6_9FIRM|nr:nucleoside-diphosphate kinase [Pectinatus brassicae]MBB5335434.1 nucleoside-diphosphate kinase [Pectinatus brassicae]